MKDENETLAALTDIFRSELDDENLPLTVSSSPVDIAAWDSLAQIRIIMRVERTFNVQFGAEEIERIDSVQAFLDALARHR